MVSWTPIKTDMEGSPVFIHQGLQCSFPVYSESGSRPWNSPAKWAEPGAWNGVCHPWGTESRGCVCIKFGFVFSSCSSSFSFFSSSSSSSSAWRPRGLRVLPYCTTSIKNTQAESNFRILFITLNLRLGNVGVICIFCLRQKEPCCKNETRR